MEGTALIVAIIALLAACAAYKKSGGSINELTSKVDALGLTTESLRRKTADILETFEKKMRGDEKRGGGQDRPSGDAGTTTGT